MTDFEHQHSYHDMDTQSGLAAHMLEDHPEASASARHQGHEVSEGLHGYMHDQLRLPELAVSEALSEVFTSPLRHGASIGSGEFSRMVLAALHAKGWELTRVR